MHDVISPQVYTGVQFRGVTAGVCSVMFDNHSLVQYIYHVNIKSCKVIVLQVNATLFNILFYNSETFVHFKCGLVVQRLFGTTVCLCIIQYNI